MELTEAENHLVACLSAPSLETESHARALTVSAPASLSEVAGIGLDTNILKAFRHRLRFAEDLFFRAKSHDTRVIVPSQCVTEFWNNHKVFANDEWSVFKGDLAKVTKRLDSDEIAMHEERTLKEIERLVGELASDLEESKSPQYLQKSQILMESLLESAIVPAVSRPRMAAIANIRLDTKTPPGWADDRTKLAALGDFYGWCDFLLGVLSAKDSRSRSSYLFITDDVKPDWRTGSIGHPGLAAEFYRVCGGDLSVITLKELEELVKASETPDPSL